jgi:hypothetical protein
MFSCFEYWGGTSCLLIYLKEIDRNNKQPLVLLKFNGDLVKRNRVLGIVVYYMPS